MSEKDKQQYEAKATKDKERYEKEMAAYNDRPAAVPAKKKEAAAPKKKEAVAPKKAAAKK